VIYYHGERRADAPGERHAIVFGINPGDKGPVSRSASRWLCVCDKLTEGYSDTFELAELIQQSTADTAELARSGDIDAMIRDGSKQNLDLIANHRPKIIIQCGLSVCDSAESAYRLVDQLDRARRPVAAGWLLRRFEMQDGTPWIVIRHPTGRSGFDEYDLEAVNRFAGKVLEVAMTPLS
jgi:hypothetical protein